MFNLVLIGQQGIESEPLRDPDGNLLAFADGADAARACRESPHLIVPPYTKLQPRRVAMSGDPMWREREAGRFATGEYQRTVWHTESWFHANEKTRDHFAHLSVKKPGLVSFTDTEEKGRNDLQAPAMRPGRYLETYFADVLSADERLEWTRKFIAAHSETHGFHIARDSDLIEYVYTHGPHSCMAYTEHRFNSSCHPVRAYGESDLGVAFLLADSFKHLAASDFAASDFRVAARAICWPDKLRYGRLYGDTAMTGQLRKLLEESGYRNTYGSNDGPCIDGDLNGAKIRCIPERGGFVLPYLDGTDRLTFGPDGFFTIDPRGRIHATAQFGLVDSDLPDEENADERDDDFDEDCWTCERCDNSQTGDDETNSVRVGSRGQNTEAWCDHCASNYATHCDGYGDRFADDDMDFIEMQNGDSWSSRYFENHGFECAECNDSYHVESRAGHNTDEDPICDSCADDMHLWESDSRYHDEPETTDDEDDSDYHCTDPAQTSLPLSEPSSNDESTGLDDAMPDLGPFVADPMLAARPCGCRGSCGASFVTTPFYCRGAEPNHFAEHASGVQVHRDGRRSPGEMCNGVMITDSLSGRENVWTAIQGAREWYRAHGTDAQKRMLESIETEERHAATDAADGPTHGRILVFNSESGCFENVAPLDSPAALHDTISRLVA